MTVVFMTLCNFVYFLIVYFSYVTIKYVMIVYIASFADTIEKVRLLYVEG